MSHPDAPFETHLEWTPEGDLRIVTRGPVRTDLGPDAGPGLDVEPRGDDREQAPGAATDGERRTRAAREDPLQPHWEPASRRVWIGWSFDADTRLVTFHTRQDCRSLDERAVEEVELTADPRLLRRTRAGGHLRTDNGGAWRECVHCRARRW